MIDIQILANKIAVDRADYQYGQGKRTPAEKRQLNKYYKENKKELKKVSQTSLLLCQAQ